MDEQGLDGGITSAPASRRISDAERVRRADWAFTTRRVSCEQQFMISREALAPRAGDVVLARVDAIGFHRSLQLRTGRMRNLLPGDEIVVAYGNHYATSQFEAVVPKTLGPCQLVAAGGVAAKALSWHERIRRGATLITPIGFLLGADGERTNLCNYAVEPVARLAAPVPTSIAVVGTSMEAGKTTTAAGLVRGLTEAGLCVGYARVTGTGADTGLLKDAGAEPVLDFTDAGYVSTYRLPLPELEAIFVTLVAHLARADLDVVVLELADGVLQAETSALLESPVFKSAIAGVFLAAADAMGAAAGVSWLTRRGLPVAGLGGVMTASPLQSTEAARATGVPAFTRQELAQAQLARKLLASAQKLRMIHGGNDARTDGTPPGNESAARA